MGSEPISTLRAVSEPAENSTVPQPPGEADAQAPAALAVRVRAAAAPPVSRLSRGLSRDGAAAAPTVQAAARRLRRRSRRPRPRPSPPPPRDRARSRRRLGAVSDGAPAAPAARTASTWCRSWAAARCSWTCTCSAPRRRPLRGGTLSATEELREEVAPAGAFRLPRRTGADGMLRRRGGVLERLLHHGEVPVLVRVAQTAPDRVVLGARAPSRDAASARDRSGCASRSASTTTSRRSCGSSRRPADRALGAAGGRGCA